jgi:dipeptidyl aminopeptidase/acylaminoacyl peptidase
VPLEAFFQNTAFTTARISPSGKYVAVGITPKEGHTQLVVLETETMKGKAVASPKDADIDRVEWVNDDRLIFTVTSKETPPGHPYEGPGLFAVQRDGSDFRELIDRYPNYNKENSNVVLRKLDFSHEFLGTTRKKDSDDIFVVREQVNRDWEVENLQLLRLNTRTGRATPIRGPGFTHGWLMDQDDVPRIAITGEKSKGALKIYDSASEQWVSLVEYDRFIDGVMAPVGFAPDGTLFVAARRGKDKRALYRYDLKARKIDSEPLVNLPDYDFNGGLVQDSKQLLGVQVIGDARSMVWFDARMKEMQAQIDRLLPATVNLLYPALRPDAGSLLVYAYSDADPGRYLLFDAKAGKLVELGKTKREIDPRQMAPMDLVRYAARDGLQVPAWLTVPKGTPKGRKLPTVVLVHGGPWVRQEWGWRADAQFLASRGYAVVEPEFRGSTGFGYEHLRRGFRQWGLSMQDDIADAARWAIAQGIADPARICIAGASYGGYATLMGLVKNPELFKCGVAWAAVSDINLLYDVDVMWSDVSEAQKMYGLPILVGDKVKDAAQFKETSPLEQAGRIKQPLLLAYGSADRTVPIVHGIKLRDAVAKTNPQVEWVEYADEGHGWKLVPDRIDFWTRVEKFLQKNIGEKSGS